MAAATASLKVKTLIPERREHIKGIREDTMAFIDKKGYKLVPPLQTSSCSIPAAREEFRAAMRKEKVYVGRVWPVCPPTSASLSAPRGDEEV